MKQQPPAQKEAKKTGNGEQQKKTGKGKPQTTTERQKAKAEKTSKGNNKTKGKRKTKGRGQTTNKQTAKGNPDDIMIMKRISWQRTASTANTPEECAKVFWLVV